MNIPPDELDQRLVVFHFKWWVILFIAFCLVLASFLWASFSKIPTTLKTEAIFLNSDGFEFVRSKISGVVIEAPTSGEKVEKGEEILSVYNKEEKKTWQARSGNNGEVVEILKQKGERIFEGETAALIQKTDGEFLFFSFLPIDRAQHVKEGMEVLIQPSEGERGTYRDVLKGKIVSISPFIISTDREVSLLGDTNLVKFFTHNEPVMEIQIEIEKGEKFPPRHLAKAIIVLSSRRIISYLIPIRKGIP